MSALIWVLPGLSFLFLLFSLGRLGSSAIKLAKQGKKLEQRTNEFRAKLESVPTPAKFEPRSLVDSASRRKQILAERTKSREARQRRLVKRLKDLSSKESGKRNV